MNAANGLMLEKNANFCSFTNTKFPASNIVTTNLYGNTMTDDPYEVTESLLLTIKLDADRFIKMIPEHSDRIVVFKSASSSGTFTEADSLVYLKKGKNQRIMIQVNTGDCPVVMFADRDEKMIAGVHSGREGTKKNIVGKTVACLFELGFKPKNLVVAVWPGICSGCYPLYPEHAAAMPKVAWNSNPSLADIIRWQLIGMDVPQKNITTPNQSKVCSAHSVFDFERGFAFASASRGPNGDRNAVCVAI